MVEQIAASSVHKETILGECASAVLSHPSGTFEHCSMVATLQVCYKCTDFLEDQVLLSGIAPGGLSDVPEAEFRTVSFACHLAQEQGLFGLKPEVCSSTRQPLYTAALARHRCIMSMVPVLELSHCSISSAPAR
jgi:hypothetical protein